MVVWNFQYNCWSFPAIYIETTHLGRFYRC
jgi:hypothetical protein